MRKGGVLKTVEIVLELEIPVTAALCPHRPSSSKPQRSHVRSRDESLRTGLTLLAQVGSVESHGPHMTCFPARAP